MGVFALVLPFVSAPLAGSPGATVGGVVAGIGLCLLAVAVWPSEWSDTERAITACLDLASSAGRPR